MMYEFKGDRANSVLQQGLHATAAFLTPDPLRYQ
jgi:hypothetical protein